MNNTVHHVNTKRLETLLCDLIDIYSPTGKEEDVVNYTEEYLQTNKMTVERMEVEENRYNLLVLPDSETFEVLFIGHIDTVPAYNFENYSSSIEDGEIFGLGAADMKGGCAAMIEAFITYWERNTSLPPAALALVVGEEENGDGTDALIKEYRAPWAIVGEPTNMIPALGHYGYLELELNTIGKRAHASLASNEHNAVYAMLQNLLKVTGHIQSRYPNAIYNIRDVHSSEAGFAVPDRCSSSIDIHLTPDSPLGTIIVEIEELLYDDITSQPKKIDVSFATVHNGYELPERGLVPELLMDIFQRNNTPWKTAPFKSHSDANLLWAAGIKPVVLGPGQLAKAHTDSESVVFAQIQNAASVYYDFLCSMVGLQDNG